MYSYQDLKNKSEVSKKLNVSETTVNKYLKLAGIENYKDTETTKKIVDMYEKCKNISQVSRALNISRKRVRDYLKKEGIYNK